jgi:hypothetical protein
MTSKPTSLSAVNESEKEDESLVDSSLTQSDPSSLSVQREEDQLLTEQAAVQEEITLLRLTLLRQQVSDQRAERDLLRQQYALLSSSSPLPSIVPSTPARVLTPVNRSLFSPSSASVYKAPSAAAIAKKQSIDSLPPLSYSLPSPAPLPSDPIVSSENPPRTPYSVKPTPPVKFTGDKEVQNADVEQWIDEANIYFDLSRIPPSDHLSQAKGLLTGYALKWLREKREEVEAAGRVMTWEWLQVQLIDEFGRSNGVAAQQAEWLALRMGVENADGSRVGGKSTYTVKAYTAQFTRLMRSLTSHTLLTTDLLVIDRYLQGIRVGYSALWAEMKGMHSVLIYDSLADAINGAQIAESALAVGKMQQSSSSPSFRSRHSSAQVNNLQQQTEDEGHTSPPSSPGAPSSKKGRKPQLNGFVYRPITEEGRFPQTEAQQRMLYDERRCFRCYLVHEKLGRCGKKMTVAPRPLN